MPEKNLPKCASAAAETVTKHPVPVNLGVKYVSVETSPINTGRLLRKRGLKMYKVKQKHH